MKTLNRQKVNFMLDKSILEEIKEWIPEGQRSDFANEALERAILLFKRTKVCEGMDKLKDKLKLKMTDDQLLSEIRYGRK